MMPFLINLPAINYETLRKKPIIFSFGTVFVEKYACVKRISRVSSCSYLLYRAKLRQLSVIAFCKSTGKLIPGVTILNCKKEVIMFHKLLSLFLLILIFATGNSTALAQQRSLSLQEVVDAAGAIFPAK
jgi:hypothetical protein